LAGEEWEALMLAMVFGQEAGPPEGFDPVCIPDFNAETPGKERIGKRPKPDDYLFAGGIDAHFASLPDSVAEKEHARYAMLRGMRKNLAGMLRSMEFAGCSVKTNDGREYEGRVSFPVSDRIRIRTTDGRTANVDWGELPPDQVETFFSRALKEEERLFAEGYKADEHGLRALAWKHLLAAIFCDWTGLKERMATHLKKAAEIDPETICEAGKYMR
jgi:hypothetical protein